MCRSIRLSGGQRQRLALALAFVNEPELVFLDEPTTGLDPQARHELHGDIARMKQDGHTVLLTTHYLDEAEQLCDRIAIIAHGRVVASGAPRRADGGIGLDAGGLARRGRAARARRAGGAARHRRPDRRGVQLAVREHRRQPHARQPHRPARRPNNEITELHVRKASLEDVFLELDRTTMTALLLQFGVSLRLHFRNRMALIYSYLFPTIFLVAFWVLYRYESPPLVRHMGELLTVTILGGACFGLPTTLVSERERGVWRRYRLTPVPTGSDRGEHGQARYIMLLAAGLVQLALAMLIGMPAPRHPLRAVASPSRACPLRSWGWGWSSRRWRTTFRRCRRSASASSCRC